MVEPKALALGVNVRFDIAAGPGSGSGAIAGWTVNRAVSSRGHRERDRLWDGYSYTEPARIALAHPVMVAGPLSSVTVTLPPDVKVGGSFTSPIHTFTVRFADTWTPSLTPNT